MRKILRILKINILSLLALPILLLATASKMLAKAMAYAPDIAVCVGWDGNQEDKLSMVNRAIKLGAKKIQLFRPHFDKTTVEKAHENGIICNVFWSDGFDDAKNYLDMGIDTILTNDYNLVSQILKK